MNLTTKRDVIQVKPYTNILRIPRESKLFHDLSKQIDDEKDTDKLLLEDDEEGSGDIVMSPVIYTEIIGGGSFQI